MGRLVRGIALVATVFIVLSGVWMVLMYPPVQTWASSIATGNVVGPGSSTATAIAKYTDASGRLLSNTGVTVDGSNNVSAPGSVSSGVGSGVSGKLSMTGSTSGVASNLTVDNSNTATTIKLPNDGTAGLYMATSTVAAPSSGCAQFNGVGTELASTGAACGAGGGGGATSGSFAGLPGTCSVGTLYYFTNSWWISALCTAVNTWNYWGQYGLGAPAGPAAGWTTVNPGTEFTLSDDSAGDLYYKITATSALNWRIATKNTPATPYMIDVFWRSQQTSNNTGTIAYDTGIYFYDGTKLMGLESLNAGASGPAAQLTFLRVEKMTNVNTDSGTAASVIPNSPITADQSTYLGSEFGGICGRLKNDGTTLSFYYSLDCHNFSLIYSEAVGTFITPTKYGIGGVAEASTLTLFDEAWVPSVYVH